MNIQTGKVRISKKALCVILSIIMAFGTFVTFTVGYSPLHEWLGIRNMLSAYAAEFVDTEGAVAVDEEAMLADDHTINLENSDGSNTVYLFSEPISFTDENGNLRTKDISVKKANSELKKEGYDYTNGQNDYRINFSKDYSKGIQAEFDGASYSIIPQSVIQVEGSETVAEYLDENFEVFQYQNIYGNGTNLRFYPQLNGIKEEIILNQKNNRNVFLFELKTENCTAQLNEDGTISLVNSEGNSIQTFAAPFAYDSEYIEGDKNEHYINCEYTLENKSEGSYLMSINVSADWLNSSDTVYPVVIDPVTSNLSQAKDAGIYKKYPNTNYGNEQLCCFGYSTDYDKGRVYTQFAIPSAIKKGATINSAYQWERETTGRTTSTYVAAHLVTQNWTETGVIWAQKPSYNGYSSNKRNINSTSTDNSSPYWYKFNIQSIVNQWVNGNAPNYGITFRSDEEDNLNKNWRAFASRTYSTSSYRPYTVINYTNETTPPTITNITKSPNWWTNQSSTFTVTASDSGSGLASSAYSFSDTQGSYSWIASNQKTFSVNRTVYIAVKDNAGNIAVTTRGSYIDMLNPTQPTAEPYCQVWTNQDIPVTVTLADRAATNNDGCSGIASYSCTSSANPSANSADWVTVQGAGSYTLPAFTQTGTYFVYAKDKAGNVSASNTKRDSSSISYAPLQIKVYIDKTEPVVDSVDLHYDESLGRNVLSVEAHDENEDCDYCAGMAYYSLDGGSTWVNSYTTDYTFTDLSDTENISVAVKDKAGNVGYYCQNLEIKAPIVYQEDKYVKLVNPYNDLKLQYRINNGEFVDYTAPIALESGVQTTVEAKIYATDKSTTRTFTYTAPDAQTPYTEEATDLSITNHQVSFDIARYYDSNTKDWYFSTQSNVTEVEEGDVYSVRMPDGETLFFVKTNNQLVNEDTGYTLTLENTSYAVDCGDYKLHYALNSGRLTCVDDKQGHGINFTYSIITHRLNSIVMTEGNETREYSVTEDSNGRLLTIETPIVKNENTHETLVFDYSDDGLVQAYYAGSTLKYSRNDDIIIGEYTYEDNRIKTSNGNTVNYENGNYVSITTPAGETVTNEEDSGSAATTEPDRTYFEGTEIVQTETVTETVDGKTVVTVTTYDESSKVDSVSVTEDNTLVSLTTYNYFEGTKTVHTETVAETVNNKTTTTVTTYDGASRVVSIEVRENNTVVSLTTYLYDSDSDNVQKETVTEGGKVTETEYTYDDDSRTESIEVKENNTVVSFTQYTYFNDTETVQTESVTETVNNETTTTVTTYDEASRVDTVSVTADGKVTLTQYNYNDSWGNLTSVATTVTENSITQSGSSVTYEYDDLNRCIKETLSVPNENDEVTLYAYNPLGNVIYERTGNEVTRTLYDEYNRVIQEIEPQDYSSSADGIVDDNNGYLTGSDSYSNSNVGHRYVYDINTRLLTQETNRLDVVTNYTYHTDSSVVATESFDIYRYEYNTDGNLTDIFVANVTPAYAHYVYDTDKNNTAIHYGNGQTVYYSYDSNKNVTAQSYTGRNETTPVTQFTYTYNTDNKLTSKTDCINHRRTDYSGNSVSVYDTSGNSDVLLYSYANTEEDTSNNSHATATKNYAGNTLDVTYGENSNQYQLNNNDVFSVNSTYTDNQLSSTVINNPSNQAVISKSYTYDNDNNVTGLTVNNTSISYVYDNDKITEYHQGTDVAYYHYDNKNQLVREDINYTNYSKTITYSYDIRGNLTKKKEYPYTRNENPGTPLESNDLEFEYEDELWLDEIVETPTETILYDENGNPYNLEDCTLEWTNGRQLKSVSNGNDVILSYTYDDNGIRTSKTYQGVTTYYCTENGVITSQYQLDTSGNKENEVIFIYDNGSLISAYYNSAMYYYITNAMGDVISIIDENENTVVDYCYDAWGNVVDKVANTTLTTDFAEVNPMLYRSYYYDEDLGVYYLQSRYYKSNWCRFINSDLPMYAQECKDEINGLNLFAYCGNKPVGNSDPYGYKMNSVGTIKIRLNPIPNLNLIDCFITVRLTNNDLIKAISMTVVLEIDQKGPNPNIFKKRVREYYLSDLYKTAHTSFSVKVKKIKQLANKRLVLKATYVSITGIYNIYGTLKFYKKGKLYDFM